MTAAEWSGPCRTKSWRVFLKLTWKSSNSPIDAPMIQSAYPAERYIILNGCSRPAFVPEQAANHLAAFGPSLYETEEARAATRLPLASQPLSPTAAHGVISGPRSSKVSNGD
jgi:hypothetical protein